MTPSERQLANWFTYHPPTEAQIEKYTLIRDAGHELAKALVFGSTDAVILRTKQDLERVIDAQVPSCADRVTAQTRLTAALVGKDLLTQIRLVREAVMFANAAIACEM